MRRAATRDRSTARAPIALGLLLLTLFLTLALPPAARAATAACVADAATGRVNGTIRTGAGHPDRPEAVDAFDEPAVNIGDHETVVDDQDATHAVTAPRTARPRRERC